MRPACLLNPTPTSPIFVRCKSASELEYVCNMTPPPALCPREAGAPRQFRSQRSQPMTDAFAKLQNRRSVLQGLGVGALGLGSAALLGCGTSGKKDVGGASAGKVTVAGASRGGGLP